MSLVTSVEPQKKRKDRFNIFLDGQFAFGVSLDSLLANNLKAGKNLNEEEILRIIAKEELAKLTDAALHFLSYRMRSEKEVTDYLVKKISKKENISYKNAKESILPNQVIVKLKKYKYLNDIEFAKWFVASRIKSKPKGLALLKIELLKKGIAREIIEKILSKNINQKDLAQKAIEKKLKNWQKLPPAEFKKKLYSYLASRGFDWETIKETFAFLAKKR